MRARRFPIRRPLAVAPVLVVLALLGWAAPGHSEGEPYRQSVGIDPKGPAPCASGPTTLCLSGERFAVEVTWRDARGGTGSAQVVPVDADDSGLLWFFSPDNWEMLIKVLDACGINNRFWVFAAATTDVEYEIRVTDSRTAAVKTYFNRLGNAAPAITDTAAFATCDAMP